MPGPRQLTGNLQAAAAGSPLEDVSAFVSSMVINKQRESISVPGTLANARATTAAGAESESLTIRFHSGVAAADFWASLYDIISTDTAEMDFAATFDPGPVDGDNPRFTGTATLMSLDTGADVGALRQQTLTLPVTAAGTTKEII